MKNEHEKARVHGPSREAECPRILVVEDEPVTALHVEKMLLSGGYAVAAVVGSAEECFDVLPDLAVSMVLMDITLGGDMDGIQAASILRDRWNLPVIFITAHSDIETLRRARLAGPYGYINKPIVNKDLVNTLEMGLHRAALDARLRESESRYRTLFELSRDAIFIVDGEGTVVDANPAMNVLLGYDGVGLRGTGIAALAADRDGLDAFMDAMARDGYVSERELLILKKNGETRHCLVTATAMGRSQGRDLYQGIIRDVTDKMKLVRELFDAGEKMKNLSSHLQLMREDERKRIAREIHDVLGQSLTALKMDITWLRNHLPPEDTALRKKSADMGDLVNSIIDSVRKISSELRPGILDDLGLNAAIEWYMEEFQKRSGISATVVFNPPELGLDEVRSVIMYRILQEAATNVVRHAGASEVRVTLSRRGDESVLTVSDNGRGITGEEIRSPLSYGLIGLKERAESCGGRIELSGEPGMGTILRAIIPCGGGTR